MFLKNIKKLLSLAVPILGFVPVVAKAQTAVNTGLMGLRFLFPFTPTNTITGFIAFIVQILLFLSGGVAVLFVVIGGFQYILSAGNEENAKKGKQTVMNAIIGLVLIILSYVIISVITNSLLLSNVGRI